MATRGRLRTSISAPSVPNNFTFSPDGRYLFGSWYYTGVSNIFRYEIASGKLDAVSQHRHGLLAADTARRRRLLIFRFTGRGFVPATIDAKPLEDVGAITFLGERLSEERPVVRPGTSARRWASRTTR